MSIDVSPTSGSAPASPLDCFSPPGEGKTTVRSSGGRGSDLESGPNPAEILILKADRVYADALRRVVRRVVNGARIRCCDRIADASAMLAKRPVDLLIAGIGFRDGDALDMLPRWTGAAGDVRKTLIVTTRKEPRLLFALSALAVEGAFDPAEENAEQLDHAVRSVMDGVRSWSRSVLEHLERYALCAQSIFQLLSPKERLVLAVVGDGTDDDTAAEKLNSTPETIASVRRELHRKLRVRHKGELQRVASEQGFVRVNFHGVFHPGLELLKAACHPRRRTNGTK
jgi:DNA-binding NarL/FixJ family response regulator